MKTTVILVKITKNKRKKNNKASNRQRIKVIDKDTWQVRKISPEPSLDGDHQGTKMLDQRGGGGKFLTQNLFTHAQTKTFLHIQ